MSDIKSKNSHPIIGIVGGMGPAASILLQQRILEATPAVKDQDHLKVICFSNPQIPDRTASLKENNGAAFVAAIIETIHALERAGATIIAIPCHTAHTRLADIQKGTSLPIVNMIGVTFDALKTKLLNSKIVGVLATDGAVSAGVFTDFAKLHGINAVYPKTSLQKAVMRGIYAVKSGKLGASTVEPIQKAAGVLAKQADAIILGCTELSVIAHELHGAVPLLDPLRILAEKLVALARHQ